MATAASAAAKLTGKARDKFIKIAARLDSPVDNERRNAASLAYDIIGPLGLRLQDALREVYGFTQQPTAARPDSEITELRKREQWLRAQIVTAENQNKQLKQENNALRRKVQGPPAKPTLDAEGLLSHYQNRCISLAAELTEQSDEKSEIIAARAADFDRYQRTIAATKLQVRKWRRVAVVVPLCLGLLIALVCVGVYRRAQVDIELSKRYVAEQQAQKNALQDEIISLNKKLRKANFKKAGQQ